MSLLMDAIKKAESAKRQASGVNQDQPDQALDPATAAQASSELSLEPLSTAAPDGNTPVINDETPFLTEDIPEGTALSSPLAEHLASIDDKFLAEMETTVRRSPHAASHNPATSASTPTAMGPTASPSVSTQATPLAAKNLPPHAAMPANAAAAHNLFTAKQPAQPSAAHNKNFALILGGFTALAVLVIGIYFWWQLQPHKPHSLAPVAQSMQPLATASPPISPTAAVSPAHPAGLSPSQESTLEVPTFQAPVAPLGNASEDGAEEGENSALPTQKTLRGNVGRTPPRAAASAPATASNDLVRLTHTPQKIDPALIRGFEAFQQGDLAAAQSEYNRAFQADPYNTDALHGLAAIAQKQEHVDQAARLYQKILEANPQDAVAQAALMNLRSQNDPAMAETRLKILSRNQPELAAPAFALGNLYVKQNRWQEAQQAYFQAYNAEPNNPDILFNLAISLEHLRQSSLAAQYYEKALAAVQNQPANFNREEAANRLQSLRAATPSPR
ncbi:MAG: hypothetical protein RugAbin2_00783 [Rugosibacter sp.]|nr:hypothetical protein [Rugosibacter sp.]